MTRPCAAPLVVIGLVAMLAGGCPARPALPDLSNLTDREAVARVHQAAARRARMVGTLKARLPGVEGMLMNATLDVAAEPPARLSVAVRSFFEQPMQVLVTDGDVLTLFDATQGTPVFRRGAVDARAVSLLLPVPLWPHEVVEVLLARPPPGARGRLVAVDEARGTFDVWLESAGGAPSRLTIRAIDDGVVRWQHFRKDGRPVVDVEYGDLRPVGNAVMPFAWTMKLLDREPAAALILTATDVIFNGPTLGDDAFRLDPPPGTPVLPL